MGGGAACVLACLLLFCACVRALPSSHLTPELSLDSRQVCAPGLEVERRIHASHLRRTKFCHEGWGGGRVEVVRGGEGGGCGGAQLVKVRGRWESKEEEGGEGGSVGGWRYLFAIAPSTERSHAGSIWAKAALMWARTTCVCRGRREGVVRRSGEKEWVVRAVVAWLGLRLLWWLLLTSSPLKAAAALGTIGGPPPCAFILSAHAPAVVCWPSCCPCPWPPPVVARVVVAVTVVVGVEAVAAAVVEVEGARSQGPWRGCPCFWCLGGGRAA